MSLLFTVVGKPCEGYGLEVLVISLSPWTGEVLETEFHHVAHESCLCNETPIKTLDTVLQVSFLVGNKHHVAGG